MRLSPAWDGMMPVTPHLVLVIHRDAHAAHRLAAPLQAAGYAVRWETDGLDGLLAVERHQPALVLLDWLLPFMGGALFLRALRAWAPLLPCVVALIAQEDDAKAVHQLGADGVLTAAAAADLARVVRMVTELMPLDRPDGGVR